MWSMNYSLHFGSARYTKSVYIGRYLVLKYVKSFFLQQFTAFLAIFIGQ